MNNNDIEIILSEKGIKPTANRILVMKELTSVQHPVNLAELEISLAPMDKTSIFRVLDLFAKHNLIHVIEDGSRSLKYEICLGRGNHSIDDHHAHFYCEKCRSIICLDKISTYNVHIPDELNVKSVNLMFKGICQKCGKE